MTSFSRGLRIALVLVLIALMAGGAWLYLIQKQQLLEDNNANLEAIAKLKVDRITEWLEARKSQAAVMMASRFYAPLISQWMVRQPRDEEIQDVIRVLKASRESYHYRNAMFVDAAGTVLFRLETYGSELHTAELQAFSSAFNTKTPTFSDIYLASVQDPQLQFDLVLPFFSDQNGIRVPGGAILYQYDIVQLMLDFWPIPSRTAETLLVRREGDSVLFLNELRHMKNTALSLKIPLTRTDVPAVMAALGSRGVVRGADYRGVKVLAVIKDIPGTSWLMVAKVDESEAFSPLRRNYIFITAAFLLLVASTFTTISVLWQRKEKTHYRSLFEAEAELRRSEARYRRILDSMREGCQIIDYEWRYIYLNSAALQFIRRREDELLNRTVMEMFPGIESRPIFQALQLCMQERKSHTFMEELENRDGEKGWFVFSIQPISEGIFVLISDVTEFEKLQKDKESLQVQLLQAQRLESVGRLAGGVAHDFNNMLNVILGHTQLSLESMEPDHPLRAGLLEIQKAAERSAELTRQLLAFARKQTIAPRVLNLNNTIGGSLNMLQRLIGEGIDLVWMPGHELWPVRMDPSQIDQILANLAINARDAIEKTGRITVETENAFFDDACCERHPGYVPGEYVMLSIGDNGCGMDKETRERIFDPFFTTKETGKGTGLGLATVFGIVKQNDGFINVYSEPGIGSIFKIYLPRVKGEGVEEDRIPPKPVPGGSETILLVEDEIAVKDLARLMLERLGYRVISAASPTEAIALVGGFADTIHMAIVDVVMPEMTGRDLAQRLIADRPGLKVLFMSGYTANVIAHHGILDRHVHFIQKPFSARSLGDKVREVLDG